jgi:hypothetical protein
MKPASRGGFSLLEVLMATSILLGSVIVLNQLAEIGRKNAADAQDLSTAQLLCETRLNELLAGHEPIEPIDQEPIMEAPGWVLSVDVSPIESKEAQRADALAALRVTVAREALAGKTSNGFTLVRWIPDPAGNRSQNRPINNSPPFEHPGEFAGRL